MSDRISVQYGNSYEEQFRRNCENLKVVKMPPKRTRFEREQKNYKSIIVKIALATALVSGVAGVATIENYKSEKAAEAQEIVFSQPVRVPGMNVFLNLTILRNGMSYWTDKDGNSFSSYNGVESSSLVDDYMPQIEESHTK